MDFSEPAAEVTGSQTEIFAVAGNLPPQTSLFSAARLSLPLLTPSTSPFVFFLLAVKAIIEHEAKNGIPPHRIILGGFSQVGVGLVCITG